MVLVAGPRCARQAQRRPAGPRAGALQRAARAGTRPPSGRLWPGERDRVGVELSPHVEAIFGTQLGPGGKLGDGARAGQVLFFDALPRNGEFKLAEDVLTPHHGPYYQNKELPGEWQSPKPHTFLTVVETVFVFHLAAEPLRDEQGGAGDAVDRAAEWLPRISAALRDALEWQGIGAKTAAGYGRLSEVAPPPPPPAQRHGASVRRLARDPKAGRRDAARAARFGASRVVGAPHRAKGPGAQPSRRATTQVDQIAQSAHPARRALDGATLEIVAKKEEKGEERARALAELVSPIGSKPERGW